MSHTVLTKKSEKFYINGRLVYDEIPGCPDSAKGLLMNARFIQGVFDDAADVARYHRFARKFDPDKNTDELISALPAWHAMGLRAFTVGFQGGGPCFTIANETIHNNPFGEDGTVIDPAYLSRMERLILAADRIGMVVIVSLFYGSQTRFLKDDIAVIAAVKTAANWLRDKGFTNVIVEIANEHDILPFRVHPILYTADGIVQLIHIAQRESGGLLTGCSGTGGYFHESIAQASDVILIHGNDQSRQKLWNLIQKAKAIKPERPVVVNEDSQALSNMRVCLDEGVSWGYYNNLTKQEPPADWRITEGEDSFFARRVALAVGLEKQDPPIQEQYYLQGLEKNADADGKRWIRLAALYPERIDRVDFFREGKLAGRAYDDPFVMNSVGSNWYQRPFPEEIKPGEKWMAVVTQSDGTVIEVNAVLE